MINAPDVPDGYITSYYTEPPGDRILTRTQTGTDIRLPNKLRGQERDVT